MKYRGTTTIGWLSALGFCLLTASGLSVLYADDAKKPDEPAKNTDRATSVKPAAKPDAPKNSAANDKEAMDLLRELNPDLADRIEAARKDNPDQVEKLLRETRPQINKLLELKQKDPDAFKLRFEELRLSHQIEVQAKALKESPGATDLRMKLRELLARRYEVRGQIARMEIARQEQQLVARKKELDERIINRDKRLDEEFKKLAEPRTDKPARPDRLDGRKEEPRGDKKHEGNDAPKATTRPSGEKGDGNQRD